MPKYRNNYPKKFAGAAAAMALARGVFRRGKGKGKKTRVRKHKVLKLNQRIRPVAAGASFSKFFYGKKNNKFAAKAYRLIKNDFLVANTSNCLVSGVGIQAAQLELVMFQRTDLLLINNAAFSGAPNGRTYLQSCSAEILITNNENINTRITIYDCMARRDSIAALGDPTYVWSTSYGDEGGVNSNFNIPGSTPFSADKFTQYFKVKKITNLELGEGRSHSHRVHYAPNRIMDGEYLNNTTNAYAGLTCFTFIVAHGYPDNDSVTKTTVSTGSIKLDVVSRKQYKYAYVTNNTSQFVATNSLPLSYAVSEETLDVATGIIKGIIQA